jgi:GTPase SAR1 family protein
VICTLALVRSGTPVGAGLLREGEGGVLRLYTPHGTARACFAGPETRAIELDAARVLSCARGGRCREGEGGGDYVVVESESRKRLAPVLVYPAAAWRAAVEVAESAIERRGMPTPVLVLGGPPGSGKTSLMYALASRLAVAYREVSPADVLSKWLGESEQRVAEILDQAAASQPFALLIDEGDMFIAREAPLREHGQAVANVQGIFKSRTAEFAVRGDRVLVAVATNLPPEEVREEFKRRGRGAYIELPYLDVPGMEILAQRLAGALGARIDARAVAREAARRRLSPADVAAWVMRLAEDPAAPPPPGPFWTRDLEVLLSRLPEYVAADISPRALCVEGPGPGRCCPRPWHYVAAGPGEMTLHELLAAAVSWLIDCGMPPVVLTRPTSRQELERAVRLARSSGSPLVVFGIVLDELYYEYLSGLFSVPVIIISARDFQHARLPARVVLRAAAAAVPRAAAPWR